MQSATVHDVMHSSKETRNLDDYLRQVCQAIEKYDTQELLAYLAHKRWSVISEKEKVDIEKESTKELKLLMLRRILGQDKTRVEKMRDVMKSYASNVHKEVIAALTSDSSCGDGHEHLKRNITRRVESKPYSEGRIYLDERISDKCYLANYYESKSPLTVNGRHLTKEPEKCVLREKKKHMDLPLEEFSTAGNTKQVKGFIEFCSDPMNSCSGSDLSGSPMDCSQVLLMETNNESRLRRTQSDIDYGYRSMTTLPPGLTQSSVSTREYLYRRDPEFCLSPPLTYCSSSESCVSDSHPQSRLISSKREEKIMNVVPVGALHSMQMLTPCSELEEKQVKIKGHHLLTRGPPYIQYNVTHNHFHSSESKPHRNSNFSHGDTSNNVSKMNDEEFMWEQTGVRSLEPYILTLEDRILKRNNGDLMQYMSMPALLPYLYQNGLVTLQEHQTLSLDSTTAFDKHGYFLQSVLPHKGPNAFHRLLKCFKEETEHSGHKYLAQLLEKEQQRERSSPTGSQSST